MYSNIVKFIHDLYKTEEFVPLHAPCFVGNEKNISMSVSILPLSPV